MDDLKRNELGLLPTTGLFVFRDSESGTNIRLTNYHLNMNLRNGGDEVSHFDFKERVTENV